jgi:hypothetical protein
MVFERNILVPFQLIVRYQCHCIMWLNYVGVRMDGFLLFDLAVN